MRDRNKNNYYSGSLLMDFYVEFLGTLVPGLFALILTLIVLILSLFVLCRSIYAGSTFIISLNAINLGLGAYGVTGILLVIAYVLGSLFFRQDPKTPDSRGARHVYENAEDPDERKRLAVQPTSEGSNKIEPKDAQFPYYFLYEYLMSRGLDHLAKWVPWRGSNKETWKYRTKMFINMIKIRINFLVPEKCKEIVRNEAHVRMATSMWYATIWLTTICVLGFIMTFIAILITSVTRFDDIMFLAVAVNILVFFFTLYIKRQIENFIHYLRVREIIYVLETAHFVSLNGYDLHPDEFTHSKIDQNDGSINQKMK
jgi:hypothetical protein